MQTVQIQCGNCQQVMAIQVEHLGAQVHCPHCQAIVQTPSRSAVGVAEAPVTAARGGEMESIFTGPEPTDALFDAPSQPLVEMPEVQAQNDSSTEVYSPANDTGHVMLEKVPSSPPAWKDDAAAAPRHDDDVPTTVRHVERKSSLMPIVMIFLIPYSIIATIVVVYLMINQGKATFDPLERLPDPKPKEGARKERVAHDVRLPDHLKTPLAQMLRIGDMEVTPVKVSHTRLGDLVLHVKAKNVSKDTTLAPMSDEFLKFNEKSMDSPRPYTFLDLSPRKLYGGFLEMLTGPEGNERPFDGDIGPGEEALLRITTLDKYRKDVNKLLSAGEKVVWRVQVRRGFVDVKGTPVSATAVIGVEFTPRLVEKEG